MGKTKQEKHQEEKLGKEIMEERPGYLPTPPSEEIGEEEDKPGLPQLNAKDWKKLIGCGG